MRDTIKWLDKSALSQIDTQKYWNDLEIEKTKEWWITDGNYEKLFDYLQRSGLMAEYSKSEQYIPKSKPLKVADLAAGTGWTCALLSKLGNISEIHAVEISKHRLDLFEHSFRMFDGQIDKVYRYLGSFYDLKFRDASMDIVYLSQAFHHAQHPLQLLQECDRILKKKGLIILVGEHCIPLKKVFLKMIGSLKKGHLKFQFSSLFPLDPVLGDHYYTDLHYRVMFFKYGYKLKRVRALKKSIYIASKVLA
ncbi:class I SAM-dependent methyltransferase [Thiorhodovibrio frisius]|uniref:Methylase involved in ubiquinone/menaquinone biosynthesis n=1 Tax=Thiorhodovibrio frisius TaxID=631362 RepID=H8Z0B2_9GAMM|nr:class I SAM-dependent methyltransferase [Thiorhodovibrio frisius]EIC22320.1 methylase involved in ubiquinone/menaquinone biosynthesis [Thiorhodovibrio frisius]WPL24617.1 Demethylmenaquinone methyltransferase [Thiorhodovibrio frisius]